MCVRKFGGMLQSFLEYDTVFNGNFGMEENEQHLAVFITTTAVLAPSLHNQMNSPKQPILLGLPEDGGSKLLQNVGNKLPANTAYYPRIF